MTILIDSSVWIAFFRGARNETMLDGFLYDGIVAVNPLILSELVPFLLVRKEIEAAKLLRGVDVLSLQIDWDGILALQVHCLSNGLNKVGIPDLIIAQQAIQRGCPLYSLDKHFRLLSKLVHGLSLIG